ncbi:DUF2239 family protein [Manganibacter manganicus]|uniref:DUF2239 domain-containing protein n=1 Tax=Manganibacter manganicus TaxID=1873176 RepID=A0A1V8RKG4_9HYPH|nr:DUF2239 family protein [Pseudaminobacter manganicus]OQM73690.1 hypothetical protein BFN67_07170 [Pseudaminobacter manganicus]
MSSSDFCTAFAGEHLLAHGPLSAVVLKAKSSIEAGANVLVFDDRTGRLIDLDLRDHADPVAEQVTTDAQAEAPPAHRTRGRPKLGVVPREVTLLPRHWEWLASQPGGASVALRRLVEEARRAGGEADRRRQGQESAYRFMTAMAGDRPNYEEAMRALFAGDLAKVEELTQDWPQDIADHSLALARGLEPT